MEKNSSIENSFRAREFFQGSRKYPGKNQDQSEKSKPLKPFQILKTFNMSETLAIVNAEAVPVNAVVALPVDVLKLVEVKLEAQEKHAVAITKGLGTDHLDAVAALFDQEFDVDDLVRLCDNADVIFTFLQQYRRCLKKGDKPSALLKQVTKHMSKLAALQLKNTQKKNIAAYLAAKAERKAAKLVAVVPVAVTIKPKPAAKKHSNKIRQLIEEEANAGNSGSDSDSDSDNESSATTTATSGMDLDKYDESDPFLAPEGDADEDVIEEDGLAIAERKYKERRIARKAAKVAEQEAEIKKRVAEHVAQQEGGGVTKKRRLIKGGSQVVEEESTTTTTTKKKTFVVGEGTSAVPFEL